MTKNKQVRTTEGLRDILFDEIAQLQGSDANPSKAMAVANLAKQIIGTAKIEMDFARVLAGADEVSKPVALGSLRLGSQKG